MQSFPALLFLLIICLPLNLSAQSGLSLWGVVTDHESGLPISGVMVELAPESRISITDQNGRFKFFYLKNTEISVRINSDGYVSYLKSDLKLEGDRSNCLKIELVPKIFYDPDQVVMTEPEIRSSGKIVINPESPEFRQASSLADIMEFIPGVVLLSSGGSNQTASISIGGAPAKQTAIFIDGVPVNSNLSGEFDINSIPRQTVKRIEIFTSGAGAEMGVGALAGAVNIITRKASFESDLSFDQQSGSYNSAMTDFTIQNIFRKRITGLLILSHNTASNNFLYDDPRLGETERENNYRDISSSFMNMNYHLNDIGDLFLTYSEVKSNAGLPGALYELTNTANKRENFRKWMLGSDLRFGNGFALRASVQHDLSRQRFKDYDSFLPYDSKYRDRRLDIILNPRYSLSGNQMFSATLELLSRSFRQKNMINESNQPIYIDEDRVQSGLIYTGRLNISMVNPIIDFVNLNLAFRHTSSNLYNPLMSPLIRVDFEEGGRQKILIHFYYSGSYRAPTYASLFWSEDAFSVGNPNLKPEKSEDFGTGVDFRLTWVGDWNFGAEYKSSYVRNLIFWERRFDGKYVPDNLAAAKIETVRWNLRWKMAENMGRFSLDYSLSDPHDRSWEPNNHNQYLTFYPRKMLDFSYCINPGIFTFRMATRWVSERYIRRANTKSLKAYTVTDLDCGMAKTIGNFEFSIKVSIDNIFSEDYQIIERYPLPRRSSTVTLGLSYNYNSGGNYVR